MSGTQKYLLLVLVGLMVGAIIPVGPAEIGPAADHGDASDTVVPFFVGEGGEGLEYSTHMTTAQEAISLAESCGVWEPGVDYNVQFDGFGTGLAPGTWDEYADMVGNVRSIDDVSLAPGAQLPSAIDHSTEDYFPIVDSQGSQGSCAAWACAYYANGYLQAKDNGLDWAHNGTNKSHLMSPAWVYNKINRGYDSGSNWWNNAGLMATMGNADWATMPYNMRDLYGWGDESAWRMAPRYRIETTYDQVATENTMVIKALLAEGYVMPMALDAGQYGKLSDDGILSSVEYNSFSSNHANTVVGYNDSITADGDAGAFLVVNSWGINWGGAWNGHGYYWMTYDALAELYWPVLVLRDKVDYEPSLLVTMDQSTLGAKNSPITLGTTSGLYSVRQPRWNGGTTLFPSFMAFDVTEFTEDVGLADFYLTVGSGATKATVSSCEVELYSGAYVPGSPDSTIASDDVPSTAPATMYAGWSGVHIEQTLPAEGTWHRGEVTINGTATESIPRVVFREDFEGRWASVWTNEDTNATSGKDAWGVSLYRKNAGAKSVWCAGSDGGTVLFEDFDDGGSLPSGWAVSSLGPSKFPYTTVNSGYKGCGGTDYLAMARSDRGAGTNMTERLYTSTPADATPFEDLALTFYIEYDQNDGDEWLDVLYATSSSYPNWTSLVNLTSDTFGYHSYDLSALDGEAEVYLAFEYHGTVDHFVTIDDVHLTGNKVQYDPAMHADLYRAATGLGAYDAATLNYSYWIDSENGIDELSVVYRTSSSSAWVTIANHTGPDKTWSEESVDVPTNASHVGFSFISDGANSSQEGAYLDDVVLTGHVDISGIDLSVDGGEWVAANASADWWSLWNTSGLADGAHDLVARVNYSGSFDEVGFVLMTDNTAPDVGAVWNDTATTGEPTALHITTSDPNGVVLVQAQYSFNARPEVAVNATTMDNLTWDLPVDVPLDAVDLWYRFSAEDTIGNVVTTDLVKVKVIDNDDPTLGTDRTPAVATTGDPLTFFIAALDNIQVANIYVEFWYDDEEHENVTFEGPVVSHTITVRHSLEPITYFFSAMDSSGNWVVGQERTLAVLDNDLPVFGSDSTPATATTGENVTLVIVIGDNIALDECRVVYRFGEGEVVNASLEKLADNTTFLLTIDIPTDSIDPLRYTFTSRDTSGNWNSTVERAVTVLDNDLPDLGADLTEGSATTGDDLSFSTEAYDNVGVGYVRVEYWWGERGVDTIDLEPSGVEDTWTVVVTALDTLDPLHYVIHVVDTSGNANMSEEGSVQMLDNDPPWILEDSSSRQTVTGTRYTIEVDVADNVGVAGVNATYRFDGGEVLIAVLGKEDVDAHGNGTYTIQVDIPNDSTDPLFYIITLTDVFGNEVVDDEVTVPVLDIELPKAVLGGDIVIEQHQEIVLDGSGSSDNVGIVSFSWRLEDDGVVIANLEGETTSVVLNDAGKYIVILTVADPSGNSHSASFQVTVNDITPPVANAGSDRTIIQNTTVIFDGTQTTDNVGVSSWEWSFIYGGVEKRMDGQSPRFIFFTPGVYPVSLQVTDRVGNVGEAMVNITVLDIVDPVAATRGDLDGKLDEAVTFDGEGSTDNVGIVNWTWTIEYDGSGRIIDVYGPVVEYVFNEPGDHRVTLTVADADGNVAEADTFTVHVPNLMLWLALLVIILGGVGATVGVALYTRRKTRKLDELRASKR